MRAVVVAVLLAGVRSFKVPALRARRPTVVAGAALRSSPGGDAAPPPLRLASVY